MQRDCWPHTRASVTDPCFLIQGSVLSSAPLQRIRRIGLSSSARPISAHSTCNARSPRYARQRMPYPLSPSTHTPASKGNVPAAHQSMLSGDRFAGQPRSRGSSLRLDLMPGITGTKAILTLTSSMSPALTTSIYVSAQMQTSSIVWSRAFSELALQSSLRQQLAQGMSKMRRPSRSPP